MRNKVELKKALICSMCFIVLISALFGVFEFYKYKQYTNNYNDRIAQIIAKVMEKYPDVNKSEVVEILNNNGNTNVSLLKEYGIDLDEDSAILENDKSFKIFLISSISLLAISMSILMFILLKYNHSKDKKLKEITKYIEELNNKNYKLDIDDNTEDELSILKNEIYKTTIMLKEIAENSMNDRVKLKDSLSDISHQLKTPLTSMSIMLDNILDNPNMDKNNRDDFIKDIKREVININFLVSSLLKLSKLDANSVNFIKKEEKIDKIITESIKNVSALCDLKNIEIKVNGNVEAAAYCDLKWQIEAITNILKNCVEHSASNSEISITYIQNKIYSKIEIIDNGIGIDKEDLPHIFERFYKGKNSSSEAVGIGLALAKSIIESNNGYISVESRIGEGTKFIIKYIV